MTDCEVKEYINLFISNQKERHDENIRKFDKIFDKLDKHPCATLAAKIETLDEDVKKIDARFWAVIIIIVIAGVKHYLF